MCSKIAPPRLKPPTTTTTTTATAVIKVEKKTTASVKIKPPLARKSRSKTRKPKYLSLRLALSQENTPHSPQMTTATTGPTDHHRHHHQLNLFPLHPDNLLEDKLDTHEENMADSFFPAGDGAAATLTGLLSATDGTSNSCSEEAENATLSPSSMSYYEEGELVRTAMRNKERFDDSEEKWVCYSEVVEEVSSSAAAAIAAEERRCKKMKKGLSLKLDYNEIINAWSDKGPFYIHGGNVESPQTVPDLHDDDFLSSSSAAVTGLWRVPEMSETNMDGISVPQVEWKSRQREASVQRYKEKRQSRLFAKKIRYQVRKLNAEKRPRIKGRFVKRG